MGHTFITLVCSLFVATTFAAVRKYLQFFKVQTLINNFIITASFIKPCAISKGKCPTKDATLTLESILSGMFSN